MLGKLSPNDQAKKAKDYAELILSSKSGQVLRLKDVATVNDSVQDLRNYGSEDGNPPYW
jgi:multidrug efflux pump